MNWIDLEIIERVGHGGQAFEKTVLEHETGDALGKVGDVGQFEQKVFGFVEDAVRLQLQRRAHGQQLFVGGAQFENLLQRLQVDQRRVQIVHGRFHLLGVQVPARNQYAHHLRPLVVQDCQQFMKKKKILKF